MSVTAPTVWTIDTAHSTIDFSVKHMMIANVRGQFREFSGTIAFDPADPASAHIAAQISVASITTGNDQRDSHLRSDDFFNAEQFPLITFTSTGVEATDESHFVVTGDLTIRDVTKSVAMPVEYLGQIKDAFGMQRAAFEARLSINRSDYNIRWNNLIESGGAIVGDQVTITLAIAAVR